MSKLQELINKLCPNGVEFKKLKELAEIGTGSSDKKDANMNGKYPFFVRSKNIEKHNAFEFDEEAIIIPGEGGIGDIFHYIKGKYALHQRVYRIHFTCDSINVKFAYYYLFAHFKSFIMKKAVSATVTSIRKPMIEDFFLPVPPIEVQEEIVRILDSFSDYAAELQAELQARKQQYEYYRNLLLTFNPSAYGCGTDDEQKDGVTTWGGHNYKIQWKKMGEIGTFIRGKRFVRTDIMEQGVPCIHYGDMYTYYGLYTNNTPTFLKVEKAQKMRFAQKNDIVIVAAGENKDDLGNAVAWLGEKPAAVHDACFIFRSNLYPNYISHICRSHNYHKQIKMFANEAKICSVSGQDLQKVLIPVPEYELQIKIASILDRFETLVNDLTNGLPAEIAAVKDQYEYYRNKLLTFKKLSA